MSGACNNNFFDFSYFEEIRFSFRDIAIDQWFLFPFLVFILREQTKAFEIIEEKAVLLND